MCSMFACMLASVCACHARCFQSVGVWWCSCVERCRVCVVPAFCFLDLIMCCSGKCRFFIVADKQDAEAIGQCKGEHEDFNELLSSNCCHQVVQVSHIGYGCREGEECAEPEFLTDIKFHEDAGLSACGPQRRLSG